MRLLHSIKKEFLETMHDHTLLAALIVFPVFVMLFMGSAFGSVEIQGLPIGVVGPTDTTFSSVLTASINESTAFNLQGFASEESAMTDFRNGRLRAVIIVPGDFEDSLKAGRGSEVRIAVDNSDIALQQAILAAMGSVVQASSTNITRSYVSAAWQDLYGLNQSAASLASGINESKRKMEETRGNLAGIRQNMSSLDITGLEVSLSSASAQIQGLQQAISLQNDSSFLDKSGAFLANASFALNESIDTVESTHARLVDQSEELNSTIGALDISISALTLIKGSTSDNLTAAALGINIDTLEALRDSAAAQEADTKAQIAELEGLNATLHSFRTSLQAYTLVLSEAKANQTGALGAVAAALSSLNRSFADADETVKELKVLFQDIDSTAADIDSTLQNVLLQTGSVESLITSLQGTVAAQTAKDPETIASPLSVRVENQYARNSFVDFIIPRVIAVSLLFSCFLLSSISLVREKTGKTIIRLLLMPGALSNAIVAKIASVTLISLGQVAMILLVGLLIFAVRPPPDLAMVALGTVVSALVLSSIGTLVGFYARTESAAIQTSLLIAIPMLFLGNIIFSPDLLPVYTQILQQLLPLAHITNIFKVVLITGGDPSANMAALLSYFVLLALVIALLAWKRRDVSHYV